MLFLIGGALAAAAAIAMSGDDDYEHISYDDYDIQQAMRRARQQRQAQARQDYENYIATQRQYFVEKYHVEIQVQGREIAFTERETELDKRANDLVNELEEITTLMKMIEKELR